MSRFATLAQAMRSTRAVIANSIMIGPPASSKRLLCPRLPGSTVTCFARKRALIESAMFRCRGASTSRMIG
jgi:hypothetical protein